MSTWKMVLDTINTEAGELWCWDCSPVTDVNPCLPAKHPLNYLPRFQYLRGRQKS
ncbi:rCG36523 [Rattus norvegicus]|uniref:RCG36523 n=1 Tax=Rattus norvegicus TaxID=10116 RepID=A6JS71_RAT|nr:rCG36523 [Rattus norvegicus]